MEKNYLLNINTGKIHLVKHSCKRVDKMAQANKKFFEKYEDAENYFDGKAKKGIPCVICFPEKQ